MNICEYTTVSAAKTTYADILSPAQDTAILSMIRQASRELDDICDRKFYPLIASRLYDRPGSRELWLDRDLLELTTLTNGDGTTIASANYRLYPLNETPKYKLVLIGSTYWTSDSSGNDEGAIQAAGVWGYHRDYASAWEPTGAALSAAITTTTQASATVTPSGAIKAGDLLKIDSEYLYASSVAVSTTDTVYLLRGVNGSTAATHLINAPLYRWNPGGEVVGIINRAAAGYTKLKGNPLGETVNVDGVTFTTPKDVTAWMRQEAGQLGLVRLVR